MNRSSISRSQAGFTMVELALVISILVLLSGLASIAVPPFIAYSNGRKAGEALRAVKAAQLMYLADNPATPVANLTQALLLPYVPNGAWPTLPSVNGVTPTINCTVFPPVAVLNGTTYNPTGSTTNGLWNVGTY
ncbi:MAG: type II secretion system protein [Verrucomicrobia bacterium]|nr:type II secretion system protein [Verrucomicrobiota bacterium]MBV8274619.1 type II secretion system protein [Verrucomicrobiota bacterium]